MRYMLDSAGHTIGKLFSFSWLTMDLTAPPPWPPLRDTLPCVEDAIRTSPPSSDVAGSVHFWMYALAVTLKAAEIWCNSQKCRTWYSPLAANTSDGTRITPCCEHRDCPVTLLCVEPSAALGVLRLATGSIVRVTTLLTLGRASESLCMAFSTTTRFESGSGDIPNGTESIGALQATWSEALPCGASCSKTSCTRVETWFPSVDAVLVIPAPCMFHIPAAGT